MSIDLRQINTGELEVFIDNVSTDTIITSFSALANSGLYLGDNVVYASGVDQNISGQKTFMASPYVPYVGLSGQAPSKQYVDDQIDTINLEGILNPTGINVSLFAYVPTPVYGSGAINLDYFTTHGVPANLRGPFDTGEIYNRFDSVLFQESSYLYTGISPFTGSVNYPTGDANWYLWAIGSTGVPGAVGSFINNGILTGSFFDSSFYVDIPYTGLSIMETFVSHSGSLTGYALGCIDSGTSNGPLSGAIYIRDTSNTKTPVLGFSMNTGVLFQAGAFAANFDAFDRIGVDIYSGITGMAGLTIGVFGMEWGG